jgi:hypothetical protein
MRGPRCAYGRGIVQVDELAEWLVVRQLIAVNRQRIAD